MFLKAQLMTRAEYHLFIFLFTFIQYWRLKASDSYAALNIVWNHKTEFVNFIKDLQIIFGESAK